MPIRNTRHRRAARATLTAVVMAAPLVLLEAQATAPLSTAVEENALLAVSCVRAVMCTAVGDQTRYGHGFRLSERWTGSRFVLQRSLVIPPKTQFTTLDGVSCPGQSDCTATGDC